MPDSKPTPIPYDPREHVLDVRETPVGTVVVTTDEALGRLMLAEMGGQAQLQLLPDLALGGRTKGLVQVSIAPLRKEPRHAAEQVSQLQMGFEADILEKAHADWWRVRGHDGYLGYLHREHLMPVQPCWNTGYGAMPKQIVSAPYAQAFAQADPDSEPVFDVSAGALLATGEVAAHEGQLYRTVYTPDMRKGFICSDDLLTDRPETFAPADILPWARSWMGTPYLWGGTSPRGLDCSGLVQLAAWLCGHKLPRDASQQALVGALVASREWADLQAGDLLFMGDVPGKITHVAIYEGEGRYIHASGRVRRNSLRPEDADFEPHRFITWQTTRRLSPK